MFTHSYYAITLKMCGFDYFIRRQGLHTSQYKHFQANKCGILPDNKLESLIFRCVHEWKIDLLNPAAGKIIFIIKI